MMAENPESTPVETPQPLPQLPPASPQTTASRGPLIGIVITAVVIVGALIFGLVMLLRADAATTSEIRDIFIIFMALESLVLGVAMVVLIVQLATLINLLQNDIKPILKSTNETVNTLRGTATFISNNLSEPVIKLNEYLAGIKKLLDILRPGRR
jgi:hypothetical protein